MATRDGYYLEMSTGALHQNLKCVGAIEPVSNLVDKATKEYDVIVVGAGYSGLTACRDLSVAGESHNLRFCSTKHGRL